MRSSEINLHADLFPFMVVCFTVTGMGILLGWFFDTLLAKLGFNPEKYRGVPLLISPLILTPIIYVTMIETTWGGALFLALIFGELGTSVGPAFGFFLNPVLKKCWSLYVKGVTAFCRWTE